MTYSYSLQIWKDSGILERELQLYQALEKEGTETTFFSYGREQDSVIAKSQGDFEVLDRPYKSTPWLFSLFGPFYYRKALKEADVFKSHQVQGSITGAIAKLLYHKPFIARSGYLKSVFAELEGEGRWARFKYWLEELISFKIADIVCVSSPVQAEIVQKKYKIKPEKIRVIPNGIDTKLFAPGNQRDTKFTLCYCARLTKKKGPDVLLEGLKGLPDVRLLMIGDGPMRKELEETAKQEGLDVQFLGRIPNEEIPAVFHRSHAYVLPTHHEGSPKTLMEAMACALPVISTNGFGVDEVFEDGVEGIKLHYGDVEGLREAILRLKKEPGLAQKMGENGRSLVLREYSFERLYERELAVLRELVD